MPSNFRLEVDELGEMTDQWLALLEIDMKRDLTLEEGIAKIESLPDAEFTALILNRAFTLGEVIALLKQSPLRRLEMVEHSRSTANPDISGRRVSAVQQEAVARPKWSRRRLVTFLERYHQDYFQKEWTRIHPWLIRASHVFLEDVSIDPIAAMEKLHPRLFFKDDAIYAQKAELYRFPYDEIQQAVVSVSSFIHPHLLIGRTGDTVRLPLAVEVPGASRHKDVPVDLVTMFKALSDGTRLKILRSLIQKPHCTQQLAMLHEVSEAAVSKHLKVLLAAHFVETERRGNYVFYVVRKSEVESIIVYLRDFLEQ